MLEISKMLEAGVESAGLKKHEEARKFALRAAIRAAKALDKMSQNADAKQILTNIPDA